MIFTTSSLSVSKIEYEQQKTSQQYGFLLPKTHNSIHNHRLVQIPCVIFLKAQKVIFTLFFAPGNDTNKAECTSLWFLCFGRKGGLIAMPRMSKKRKQEWALFLNERNRITYNELCRKCSNNCKQSFRCIVVLCAK